MSKENTASIQDLLQDLKAKRRAIGKNQQELAKEVGISRSYLSAIENGHAEHVELQLAIKLLRAVGYDGSVVTEPLTASHKTGSVMITCKKCGASCVVDFTQRA